jgi:A/G-specific adenine glycosylase
MAPRRPSTPQSFTEGQRRRIPGDLLDWYDLNRRPMPWRETTEPYAIWLSEIMLQQTRVETVIPYYQRFRERFPTVEALGKAELDEVLGQWSGLGYYRRARLMHAAAREVTETYGGRFPADVTALRSLPGVGRYTAGAIASIAFGVRAPLVDGNVVRVLSRLIGAKAELSERELYALAGELVPEARPGDFNQGLMELGATVCTPERPRCEDCPLRETCVGRAQGAPSELGRPRTKPKTTKVPLTAAVAVHRGKVLLGKRPSSGLFAGLWEPPMVPSAGPGAAERTFARAGVKLGDALGEVRHVLTHRVLEVSVRQATIVKLGELAPYEALELSTPTGGRALSTLAKKVIAFGTALVALAGAPSTATAAEPVAPPLPAPETSGYLRVVGSLSMGKGLRLSNPYRLDTVLGETASSASLTAAFLDGGLALLFGEPDAIQHGGAVHFGVSVEGVGQPYASACYELAYRADEPFLVHGRVGPAFLLAPDFNVGGEVAGGFSYFFTSGLGLTSELAFDLFYGAATLDSQYSAVPVLSLSLGVVIDYEVLP